MSHLVYLALGTNLGDRIANLNSAIRAMPPVVQPQAASQVYETPPWGVLDQPAFLNQVIRARTELAPGFIGLAQAPGTDPAPAGLRYGRA
jgi:2-amino-4-hydroxy-6-hydroxymethyldihydropteridine diphosphokinase